MQPPPLKNAKKLSQKNWKAIDIYDKSTHEVQITPLRGKINKIQMLNNIIKYLDYVEEWFKNVNNNNQHYRHNSDLVNILKPFNSLSFLLPTAQLLIDLTNNYGKIRNIKLLTFVHIRSVIIPKCDCIFRIAKESYKNPKIIPEKWIKYHLSILPP